MTSPRDICTLALVDSGVSGSGITPSAEQMNQAFLRLQWMMDQWQVERWLVFRTRSLGLTSTGAASYTVGPGGDYDVELRPDKLENGNFSRQLQQGQPYPVDYPLQLINAREDYNEIALKTLVSFPSYIFYDPSTPLGVIYPWPVPQASIYATYIMFKEVLQQFENLDEDIELPKPYFQALYLNLAVAVRDGMSLPPKPVLIQRAKVALNTLRGSNIAIKMLDMPSSLVRPGIYNPYSDRIY